MAEKRTINIDINSNASEAEKDFKSFNKAVDETTKSAKNLDATFEEVYGDLQPLTTRMGEAEDRLYELALAGDTASKEYQELLEKVGAYRKVQIQTDLAVDGAATTMTQKLGSALNGATSGFAATQGAMALFGDENQALEESLLKVQSALAIQQGVQGLTEAYRELSIGTKIAGAAQAAFTFVTGGATTAMKLFRLALISTGIGAIVVAVGMLIANFDKIQEVLSDVNKGFKDGGIVTKALMLAFAPLILTIKAATKGLQMLGVIASDEDKKADEIHKAKMARYLEESKALSQQSEDIKRASRVRQKALNDEIEMLEAQGKKTTAIKRKKLEEDIALATEQAEMSRKQAELAEKNNTITAKANRTLYEARLRFIKEAERKLLVFDTIVNREKLENYKEYAKERSEETKKLKEEEQRLLDEEIDAEIKLLEELDKIRIENEARFKTEQENELLAVEQKYDVLQSMAYGNAEALKEIEIARLNENNEINLKYANEAYEAEKAIKDKAAADQKILDEKAAQDRADRQNAQIDLAVQGFQLIAGIAEAFAGEDVKRQKKAFQIKKVADIAAATVDGYRAVLSTYAQTPGGPVIKGIAAGLAGSFAALQIANIAKQQFQGGGDGADVAASADAGGAEAVTPQFNVVGDSGINQIAQLQQQPVQAFVVSGEVTTSQALDRNRVQNATL